MRQFTASLVIASAAGIAAAGVTNPYTENFEAGANGWTDIAGGALNEVATGGVDGSAYVNTAYSFNGSADGDLAVLFRGNAPGQNASGGAFAGDWIAGGVTNLSFDIRHNGPAPLTFFARIATNTFGAPFPAAVAVNFAPVFAGGFTTVSIDINPANPAFVTFEESSFETIFSNVGFIQIGVLTPDGFGVNPAEFDFDLDNVRIVPAPGAFSVLAGLGLAATRRRRA